MRRSKAAALTVSTLVVTGSALTVAPATAFADDGSGATATVVALSSAPGGYQLSLAGIGSGVVIDYTVTNGQISSVSTDASSTVSPTSVVVTDDGIAVALLDGTVVSVDLGDTKATVDGVDVSGSGTDAQNGNTDSQSQEPPEPTDTATEAPQPTDTATEAPEPTDTATESPQPTDTATESPQPTETQQPTESQTENPDQQPSGSSTDSSDGGSTSGGG